MEDKGISKNIIYNTINRLEFDENSIIKQWVFFTGSSKSVEERYKMFFPFHPVTKIVEEHDEFFPDVDISTLWYNTYLFNTNIYKQKKIYIIKRFIKDSI